MNLAPPAPAGGSDSGIPGLLGGFLNRLRSSPLGGLLPGGGGGGQPGAAPQQADNQFALAQAMKLLGGGSSPMSPMPWMQLRPPGRMG
jgi:hypothetical protein